MSRRRALLVALAAAAVDAGALLTWWRIHEERRVLTGPPSGDQLQRTLIMWGSFENEARTFLAAGAVTTVVALAVVIAGLRWAWRDRAQRALRAAAVVAPALILGLSGAGMLRGGWALLGYWDPCADPVVGDRIRYDELRQQGAVFAQMGALVVASALLASVVVLVLARRGTGRVRGSLGAPLGMFMVGLGAFVATRGEGYDLRHPMPMWERAGRSALTAEEAEKLPPASPGCEEGTGMGPTAALKQGRWVLDGQDQRDGEAMAEALGKRREMWNRMYPNGVFPGVIEAAIPAATPMAEVGPLFTAAREAGYVRVDALEVLPGRQWATRTLGVVEYRPRVCRVSVAVERGRTAEGSWGELVKGPAGEQPR